MCFALFVVCDLLKRVTIYMGAGGACVSSRCVCCVLFVACYVLRVVCCVVCVVCCVLCVVCNVLCVACCVLCVVCACCVCGYIYCVM